MSKIFILVVFAACQVAIAQRPTVFPNLLGTAGLPNSLGSLPTPPFLGAFGTANWGRPYYTAVAEGWRTYFEQLQKATAQLYQTLTNLPNNAQNGDLQPPAVQVSSTQDSQHDNEGAKRPQVQNDAQQGHPQGQINQPGGGRRPQNVNIQGVASPARPLTSGILPQGASPIVPQLGPSLIPQVPWVGK